jgi:transcriptional regulator with XRE-family HTH domain
MVVVVTMTDEEACLKFGREVRRLRLARGLTVEQLAQRCSLTPNHIGSVENGKRAPSLFTILALASGLGVPPGELFPPAR